MRWTVHGERVIYDSPWVRLALTDVEIPGGRRFGDVDGRAPRGGRPSSRQRDAPGCINVPARNRFRTATASA